MHGRDSSGPGCGPPDQAARLRRMIRQHRAVARTIAITSGKGGVGKSNFAVNLSICLAARGPRVALVDVDLGLANADLLMDLQPPYTLAHVLAGVRTLDDICMEGPGGIRFVPGASGMHDLANLSEFDRHRLLGQFQNLENSTDIVVLDCGAGISRNVTTFALAADETYVVTTPQPTALTDAYATVKALVQQKYTGRVSLLVNMAHSRAAAQATYERVAGVAGRFLNYPVADGGYLLHDSAVELAVQERCPFVIGSPGCNASACVAAIARELARKSPGAEARGGFFRRVVGLFL
ncbi:MAG: MinD/ParA family protein [Planctomycetes bacterium]|nr:MinD/ParA family protein [Planctomycetota bacterium]